MTPFCVPGLGSEKSAWLSYSPRWASLPPDKRQSGNARETPLVTGRYRRATCQGSRSDEQIMSADRDAFGGELGPETRVHTRDDQIKGDHRHVGQSLFD